MQGDQADIDKLTKNLSWWGGIGVFQNNTCYFPLRFPLSLGHTQADISYEERVTRVTDRLI